MFGKGFSNMHFAFEEREKDKEKIFDMCIRGGVIQPSMGTPL